MGAVIYEELQLECLHAECSIELLAKDRPIVLRATATKDVEKLTDCQRCSSLQKLLKITARVLGFVHKLKMKTKHAIEDDTASAEPNHAQKAELFWIWAAQVHLLQDPHFEKLKGAFLAVYLAALGILHTALWSSKSRRNLVTNV